MAALAQRNYIYNSATALKTYAPVTLDTTVNQVVPAALTTDAPLGVLAEDTLSSPSGQTVGVHVGGENVILKGIAGGVIAIGDKVGVTASGLFNTIALAATYQTTAKYMWGIAISAASASGDVFTFKFMPSIISTAS